MRSLISILSLFAVAFLAGFAAPAVATAGEAQYSRVADVDVQLNFGSGGGYRVCCKRGWNDWWSTARQCRRSGGHIVGNRACRDDRWGGGYGNVRVCCKRGWRDWWSTQRECRHVGGYIVANRECRYD